jgi:peptide-methionine (R)-S-oxide reductase
MPLNPENWNQLSPEERYVIENKGTEYPFTGVYDKFYEKGIYVCKRCEVPLYTSDSKFNSGCGWPAFDSNVEMNVERVLDADGRRVEIICQNCKGHLGHVFEGEGFTETNTRHCVNSISIKFIPD